MLRFSRVLLALAPLGCASAAGPAPATAPPPAASASASAPAPAPAPQPAAAASAPADAPPALGDGDLAFVPSPCGVYVVGSWAKRPFSALLVARELKTIRREGNDVWLLDGVLVKVALRSAEDVGAAGLRGAALLDRFRAWEIDQAAKLNGWTTVDSKVFMTGPARQSADVTVQVYSYKPPVPYRVLEVPVTAISLATATAGEFVVSVWSPLEEAGDPDKVLAVLDSFLSSVKLEAPDFSVQALAERVRGETAADARCQKVHGKAP